MINYIQTALLTGLLGLLPLAVNAQTCKPDTISATTQFTDNGDGTVTDSKTGLMWKKCTEGKTGSNCNDNDDAAQHYTWQAALNRAQTINSTGGFAGYNDWRLPNIKELRGIVERQCYEPAINLTQFPNTDPNGSFWSSSPFAYNGSNAWFVEFSGGFDIWSHQDAALFVRLVRGR